MLDPFAAPDSVQNSGHFIYTVRTCKDRYWPADHLLRGVAKYPRGRPVPAGNETIQILADDCIIRRFDDGCQKHLNIVQSSHRKPPFTELNFHIRFLTMWLEKAWAKSGPEQV